MERTLRSFEVPKTRWNMLKEVRPSGGDKALRPPGKTAVSGAEVT
jgi:hypothetical protein